MYAPMTCYLYFWLRDRKDIKVQKIPVKWFLLCSVIDVHANLLTIYAYEFTSLTSVMLLQDFTIPSAVLLSVFFLKIRYKRTHFMALFFCLCGMSISISNDLFVKNFISTDTGAPKNQFLGDIMTISGAFLFALSNILQEHFLKTSRDVFHYVGFLGLFGLIMSIIEATATSQLSLFTSLIKDI